ncbi:hypothetical protein TNCV_3909651 [Trichonephila clavipes]|nr:hypothetical protein TNCV_3909651 [Trichonephila clavipes]
MNVVLSLNEEYAGCTLVERGNARSVCLTYHFEEQRALQGGIIVCRKYGGMVLDDEKRKLDEKFALGLESFLGTCEIELSPLEVQCRFKLISGPGGRRSKAPWDWRIQGGLDPVKTSISGPQRPMDKSALSRCPLIAVNVKSTKHLSFITGMAKRPYKL